MNGPMLFLVTLTYRQAADFCNAQRLNLKEIVSFATDNSLVPERGRYLTDLDAIIWYGPWREGKNVGQVIDVIDSVRWSARPFEYDVYQYNEVIPWPAHIAERYVDGCHH